MSPITASNNTMKNHMAQQQPRAVKPTQYPSPAPIMNGNSSGRAPTPMTTDHPQFRLYDELQAILEGFYGGARYGARIRFPHALVMTLLFYNGNNKNSRSTSSNNQMNGNHHHHHNPKPSTTMTTKILHDALHKLRHILKLTYAHASRLAVYAAGYKLGLVVFKWAALKYYQQYYRYNPEQKSLSSPQGDQQQGRSLGETLLLLILYGTTRMNETERITMATQAPSAPSTTINNSLPPPFPAAANLTPGRPLYKHHSLLAGMTSAYFAWGRANALNYQVLLYVASRVVVGTWKRLLTTRRQEHHENGHAHHHHHRSQTQTTLSYRLFSGLIWGTAMILFEESPETLPGSMVKSMKEIYYFTWPKSRGESTATATT